MKTHQTKTIDLRVCLTEKANKKLTLYKVYRNMISKQDALNKLLEELDVSEFRDEFFLKEENDEKVK
jgi:hypothetical protein